MSRSVTPAKAATEAALTLTLTLYSDSEDGSDWDTPLEELANAKATKKPGQRDEDVTGMAPPKPRTVRLLSEPNPPPTPTPTPVPGMPLPQGKKKPPKEDPGAEGTQTKNKRQPPVPAKQSAEYKDLLEKASALPLSQSLPGVPPSRPLPLLSISESY